MSRHNRKVPVGFYCRFTRETCKLADVYAHSRIVSVLEGGYSDRALTSGAMAHLCGLVDLPGQAATSNSDGWVDDAWWGESNLVKVRGDVLFCSGTGSHTLRSSKRLSSPANPRQPAQAWRIGLFALSAYSQSSTVARQTRTQRRRPLEVHVPH